MGCNPSKHTTVQDTTGANCNGSSTNEKADDELDVKCGAEAAAESSEAPEGKSESNALCPATELTPEDDPEAGAPAAGRTEQTGSEDAPGHEEL